MYHIDEHEANEYDKKFVAKEQGYQVSQEIFSIAYRSYLMDIDQSA